MLQSIQDFKDVVESIDKMARRITKQSAAISKDIAASDGTIVGLVLGQLEDQRRRPVVMEAQKLLKELSADSTTIQSDLGYLVEAILGAEEPTRGTAAEVWNGDAYSEGFGVDGLRLWEADLSATFENLKRDRFVQQICDRLSKD